MSTFGTSGPSDDSLAFLDKGKNKEPRHSLKPMQNSRRLPERLDPFMRGGDGDRLEDISMLRRKLSVVLCAASIFFEGINLSLAGPFFPDEASKKGLSQINIGWVMASMSISSVISLLLLIKILSPKMLKFFYVSGLVWVAVATMIFGYAVHFTDPLHYFIVSLACQVVSGSGVIAIQITSLPIISRLYPDKSTLMTTIFHIAFGFGELCGPFVGNFTIPNLGYQWPFYGCGVIIFSIAILVAILVPSKETNLEEESSNNNSEKFSLVKMIFRPRLLLFLIPEFFLFSSMGYRGAVLTVYLEQNLNVTQNYLGYMFVPFSLAFVLAAPVFGYITKLGLGSFLLVAGEVSAGLIWFLLFLPKVITSLENIYWVLSLQFLCGIALSAILNPHFLLVEKIAIKEGIKNPVEFKTLSTLCFTFILSTSTSVGAFLFGGYIYDAIGFYYTSMIYGIILTLMAAWEFIYLWREGFLKKLNYITSKYDLEESVDITFLR